MNPFKIIASALITSLIFVWPVHATQVVYVATTDFSNGAVLTGIYHPFGGGLGITLDTVSTLDPATNGLTTVFDAYFQGTTNNYLAVFSTTGTGSPSPSTMETLYTSTGTVDPLANGAFDASNSNYWTQDNKASDISQFQGTIGFGTDYNVPYQHVQLEINTQTSGVGALLSMPVFLSISMTTIAAVTIDPPISSAIFQLNPDGTLGITPVLDLNGDPVLLPNAAVPEPSSLALLSLGGIGLAFGAWRRRKGSVAV